MNDDNTDALDSPLPIESKPKPVDFALPFDERIRSGIVLELNLAEARERAHLALRGLPDWIGEWRIAARRERYFDVRHARFNTQVVIAFERKGPRDATMTMHTLAPEPFVTALSRAVHGIVSAIPELVTQCIQTFGLVPIEGGYARTRGEADDPDNDRYPMDDFIDGYAHKYELYQQKAIGDLVGVFAGAFEPKTKANLVAKALDEAATNASMTMTQGYRVLLDAPQSLLLCCDQVVRVTQESGFLASPPEWVDSACLRIHLGRPPDPSGNKRLVANILVFQRSSHTARIEIDVPAVDTLTPLVVKTIEDIRETLGAVDVLAEILTESMPPGNAPSFDLWEIFSKIGAVRPIPAESLAERANVDETASPQAAAPKEDTPPAQPSEFPITADDPRLAFIKRLEHRQVVARFNTNAEGDTSAKIGRRYGFVPEYVDNIISIRRKERKDAVRRKK